MFYTIYKTTNLVNGKIYIGSHKTKDLDDGYLGSGKYLRRSIDKHGKENFKKEILFVFDAPAEMYAKEAELVNEDFLAEENTYNLKVGGFGGFDYINRSGLYGFSNKETARLGRQNADKSIFAKYGTDWRKIARAKITEEDKRKAVDRCRDTKKQRGIRSDPTPLHTEEAIKTRKQKFKEISHSKGSKNSQFGTMWITDGNKNKKINCTDSLPEGFRKGRFCPPGRNHLMSR